MKPEVIKNYRSHSFQQGCWVTSDLHFLHENGAKYRNMSLSDMHDAIFEGNKLVGKNETLYILGDLSMCREKDLPALEVLISSLRGRKILVLGNHDSHLDDSILRHFEHVAAYIEATVPKAHTGYKRNTICVMNHYPIVSWNKMHHASWHLHGHCHGNLKFDLGKSQDVGLDCNDMKPFSFDQILEIMNSKKIGECDHHLHWKQQERQELINSLYEKIDALERMVENNERKKS